MPKKTAKIQAPQKQLQALEEGFLREENVSKIRERFFREVSQGRRGDSKTKARKK